MAHPASPKSIADLRAFLFKRVLNEDPLTHSVTLLGSFPGNDDDSANRVQAIIRIEKTALDLDDAKNFFEPTGLLDKVQFEEGTDIVTCPLPFLLISDRNIPVLLALWLAQDGEGTRCQNQHNLSSERGARPQGEPHLVDSSLIGIHLSQYTKQNLAMVRETPDLFESVVKPYILAFPPSRTQWYVAKSSQFSHV